MRWFSLAFVAGLVPRCHFEDITRADFYGFVVPFVNELTEMSRQAGIPVKIRACDTMGYGVPYPGAALPRSVAGIVYGLRHYADVRAICSSGTVTMTSIRQSSTPPPRGCTARGRSTAHCSASVSARATCPLEAMVFEYASLRGSFDGMDPTVITEIADYFRNEIGYNIPEMTPFVGRNFNTTRAGIHADGLLKDEEIYNIFNTKKLLNRPAAWPSAKPRGLRA